MVYDIIIVRRKPKKVWQVTISASRLWILLGFVRVPVAVPRGVGLCA